MYSNEIEKIICLKKEDNLSYKIKSYIKTSIIVSISANMMIIPVMAYSMNTLSLTFIIPNLLIGPLIIILEILGIIYIFIPNFFILNFCIQVILDLINNIALYCSKIPFSSINVSSPNIIEISIFYLILFYFYINLNKYSLNVFMNKIINKLKKVIELFKRNIKILIIFIIIISIIFFLLENIKEQERGMNIYFLDVGQGDCTYIETKEGKKVLIDGGGNESYDIGKNVLKPYFLKRGIKKFDYIIISHLDYDHVGGIISLLEYIETEKIILPIQFEEYKNFELLKNKLEKTNHETEIIFLKAGDRVVIDRYTYINVLWPDTKNIITENSINNNALVFNLNFNNFSMLFTGDIEKGAEEKIVKKYENNKYLLKTDVLKVGHHGAETSSIEELINIINPKVSVIGVGRNNKYGHPNLSVLNRLEKIKSFIYRTDLHGQINISIDKNGEIKEINTYY